MEAKRVGLMRNLWFASKFKRISYQDVLSLRNLLAIAIPQNNKSFGDFFDDKGPIFEFPLSENSGKNFS